MKINKILIYLMFFLINSFNIYQTLCDSHSLPSLFHPERASSSLSHSHFMASMPEAKKFAIEIFEGEDLLVDSLAKYVVDLSNKFTSKRGAFTVCLSGGSMIEYLRWGFFSYKNVITLNESVFRLNWIGLIWMCFVLGSQETVGITLCWFYWMVQMASVLAGWEGCA